MIFRSKPAFFVSFPLAFPVAQCLTFFFMFPFKARLGEVSLLCPCYFSTFQRSYHLRCWSGLWKHVCHGYGFQLGSQSPESTLCLRFFICQTVLSPFAIFWYSTAPLSLAWRHTRMDDILEFFFFFFFFFLLFSCHLLFSLLFPFLHILIIFQRALWLGWLFARSIRFDDRRDMVVSHGSLLFQGSLYLPGSSFFALCSSYGKPGWMIRLAASYMFIVYGMHMHVLGVDGVVFPCLTFFTVPDCTPDACLSSTSILLYTAPYPFLSLSFSFSFNFLPTIVARFNLLLSSRVLCCFLYRCPRWHPHARLTSLLLSWTWRLNIPLSLDTFSPSLNITLVCLLIFSMPVKRYKNGKKKRIKKIKIE